MIGNGITSAYSEQFGNYRSGDGFRTNRGVLTYKCEREIAMIKALCPDLKDKNVIYGVRGLAKNKALDPATIGPKHSYTNDGSPWEMGPVKGKIQTSNTAEDLSGWDTNITTQKAIASGLARETTVQVNSWGWDQSGMTYEKYWVGQPYIATNHNSNYATAMRIYGSNGDVPDDIGWAPQFR